MTISTKHKFVSSKPDSTDTTLIQASNWNDDHDLVLSTGLTLIGNPTAGSAAAAEVTLGDGLSFSGTELQYDSTIARVTGLQTALDLKAPLDSPTFTGTVSGITSSMVGLGNVDNTSDADKPVSTATQTALDGKAPVVTWDNENANVTVVAGSKTFVDCSGGVVTVTLPATPAQGDEIRIIDATGSSSTNNITVARNGSNILGVADDLVVATDYAAFGLVYYDASNGWLLIEK